MPVRTKSAPDRPSGKRSARSLDHQVDAAQKWLACRGSKRNREGMARYGITAEKVFGVSVSTVRTLAKRPGRDHELALALWDTGWYEARLLAAFVAEPERVTAGLVDRWCKDFEK